MFGYITVKRAKALGFTHHGRYYGIPVYMSDSLECPMVACKWAPLELLFSMACYVEQLVAVITLPDVEPCFRFKRGKRL